MTVRSIRPACARGHLRAPPSKSYTHRALIAAFLAEAPCDVVRPLDSDDTRATREGLRALGARVRVSREVWSISPMRHGTRIPGRTIRCGESGTTLRFLSAVAALYPRPARFEGTSRLAARPMSELYEALRKLGATIETPPKTRSLPCMVRGPLTAGSIAIRGDVSSQFTSALLMVLPKVGGRSELKIRGRIVSGPYVDATCAILKQRGIRLRRTRGGFAIPGGQTYRAGKIRVPGDASSAAYLWAAAAATGGRVEIEGVPADLPQADLEVLPILAKTGARVERTPRYVRVTGPMTGPVSVDLTDSPDLFPLVSVLAALVPDGLSRLSGAPHLEFKESDRRVESVRLARALGARVSATGLHVDIRGSGSPRPLNVPALQDHRLVMSAAIGGLAAGGTSRIGRAEAVSKSFPGFWNALGVLTEGGEPVR